MHTRLKKFRAQQLRIMCKQLVGNHETLQLILSRTVDLESVFNDEIDLIIIDKIQDFKKTIKHLFLDLGYSKEEYENMCYSILTTERTMLEWKELAFHQYMNLRDQIKKQKGI